MNSFSFIKYEQFSYFACKYTKNNSFSQTSMPKKPKNFLEHENLTSNIKTHCVSRFIFHKTSKDKTKNSNEI